MIKYKIMNSIISRKIELTITFYVLAERRNGGASDANKV